MKDEFKTPNQSDEFKPNDEPYQDETIEQFEQNESDGSINQSEQEESIEPMEDINKIESIVEPEPDSEQKIEIAYFTKPAEIVDSAAAETAKAVKLEPENVKPAENIPPISNNEVKKTVKKGFVKKLLTVIVVIILMAGSAAAAYWWRDKQANDEKVNQSKTIQTLQEQVDALKTDKSDISSVGTVNNNGGYTSYCDQFEWTPTTPAQSILDNIKAVITTANTEPLKGYLADNQNVVTIGLESSTSSSSNSGLSDITSFLESTSRVWTFNLSDLEMGFYNNGQYGSYFKDAGIIGKSDAGQIVAISFDCQSKIYRVLQAYDAASVR